MKKAYFLAVTFIFLSAVIGIKAQTPSAAAFLGNWQLDKEKTDIKDLPQKFKDYKMIVTGNEATLSVRSQVEGPVEIQSNTKNNGGSVSTSSSRSSAGAGSGLGVSASTGGVSSGTGTRIEYGGTMALYFTTPQVSYKLNGEEEKIVAENGSIIRIKAKPDKNGKAIQFTTIRRMKTPNGEMEIIAREYWKLSEDGKTIKFQRTIETPASRDEITIFLKKVE